MRARRCWTTEPKRLFHETNSGSVTASRLGKPPGHRSPKVRLTARGKENTRRKRLRYDAVADNVQSRLSRGKTVRVTRRAAANPSMKEIPIWMNVSVTFAFRGSKVPRKSLRSQDIQLNSRDVWFPCGSTQSTLSASTRRSAVQK